MNNDNDLLAQLTGKAELLDVPDPTPPPPRVADVEVFDFGNLKKTTPASKTKTEYPVLPDKDGAIAKAVDDFLHRSAMIEGLEQLKAQFKDATRGFHFTENCGRADVRNAVSLAGTKGEVLVQFKDAYCKLTSLEVIRNIIGPDMTAKYFHQAFTIAIKSEAIPRAKAQDFIKELGELAAKHGVSDAVDCSPYFTPNEEWHIARYRDLTPAQNELLESQRLKKDSTGYMTVAITTAKGRKGK